MRQQPRAAVRAESPAAESLAASSVMAVLRVGRGGRIAGANALAARLLGEPGPDGLVGRSVAELLAPGQGPDPFEPAVDGAVRRGVTVHLKRRDGQLVILRGDVVTRGEWDSDLAVEGQFTDCTELEQLRHSMQHGARLEALASLIGGVAHDFNNLLTVLIGNLSLTAEEFRDHPRAFARLKSARDAAARGSDLIGQLLGFAGAEQLETSVVDPSEVVRRVVPLLGSALGRRIRLETELETGKHLVEANAAQLESAIVNLAVNARDAIEGRGTVVISSSLTVLDANEGHELGLGPGRFIRIGVADDGSGMTPELQERVFEPFFSTKKARGGTGLGLSMVRSLARRLGGHVAIRSRPGKGTAVMLWLPVSDEPADTLGTQTAPFSTLPAGTEHVVVLGSEAGLAATVRQILETLGYSVTVCSDTPEAALAAPRERADLLIVDGAQDADQRSTPAALLSGPNARVRRLCLLDARDAEGTAASGADAVLWKPFSPADLASAVRTVLDGAGAGSPTD